MRIIKHLRLCGRVQGVFFRESLYREAIKLGVNGWVRNRRDGSLEAMLQGEEDALCTLITWARRGPPIARIENIEISDGYGEFTSFDRRPTA